MRLTAEEIKNRQEEFLERMQAELDADQRRIVKSFWDDLVERIRDVLKGRT